MLGNKSGKHHDESVVEEIGEDFDKFESWAIENWKLIGWLCVAIVIVVAAVAVGMSMKKASDRKTAELFASADTIEKLQAAISAHPSSPAAPLAQMKLAMMQADKKSYDAALSAFKSAEASCELGSIMRSRAGLDAAYTLELQGKKAEATAAFLSLGDNLAESPETRAEAYYSAGRLIHGKGDAAKARLTLEKAISQKPGNSLPLIFWSTQATLLKERLAEAPAPNPPKG